MIYLKLLNESELVFLRLRLNIAEMVMLWRLLAASMVGNTEWDWSLKHPSQPGQY